jgi:hypothetical protein
MRLHAAAVVGQSHTHRANVTSTHAGICNMQSSASQTQSKAYTTWPNRTHSKLAIQLLAKTQAAAAKTQPTRTGTM